jgi:hypothetical protein
MDWGVFERKHCQIKMLYRHLLERSEENHQNLNRVSQYAGRDLNRSPPEHEFKALQLHQPARRSEDNIKAVLKYIVSNRGTI